MDTMKKYFERLSTGDPPGVSVQDGSFIIRIEEDKETF